MRRNSPPNSDKVEQNMTAMIDVVFQLLTFFVMSFRVAAQEGDFSIKMPLAKGDRVVDLENRSLPLKLQLIADVNGELSSIRLNSTPISSQQPWEQLQNRVFTLVDQATPDPAPAELEIQCDAHLKYAYVIDAMSAVSGYTDQAGDYVKMIDSVKFGPPATSR